MSMEIITIVSLGLTIVTVGIMLAGLILHGLRTQRADIKALQEDTQSEFKAMREETQSEFKAVQEEIGGLRERMAHLAGLIEGLREAITGRRVAESPGQYDTN